MKFYKSTHTYDYPFPAVTLAYFLRYPNPLATHVLSTDVLSRHFDPDTQRLTTTRLHLKHSKIPAPVLKLLPKGIITNKGPNGEALSLILEKSTVDIRQGWMETETRNLQYTGVLSVVERQRYCTEAIKASNSNLVNAVAAKGNATTQVATTVTFESRFGQRRRDITESPNEASEDRTTVAEPRQGFFKSWSTAALQRTIESTGLQRTRTGLAKSAEGMTLVLERMRKGGLTAVLDGMRRDRETVMSRVAPS